MRTNYLIRAERFVRQIDKFLDGDRTNLNMYKKAVLQFNERYHRSVILKYGLCRVVFITSDYVVKIDYDPDEVKQYGGCEDEYSVYQKVKNSDYADYFAEITKIVINEHIYYIMPRIGGIGWRSGEAWEWCDDDVSDFILNYCADLHDENYGWKDNHIVLIDYACTIGLST